MATSTMNKLNQAIKAVESDHLSILHIVRYTMYRKQKENLICQPPCCVQKGCYDTLKSLLSLFLFWNTDLRD